MKRWFLKHWISGKKELTPEIWKTSEMTPTIALACYLESLHAAAHGDPSGAQEFQNLRRWSWEFRKAKC